MRLRTLILVVLAVLGGCWGLLHAQKPFKEYETVEGHAESDIPPDYAVPHEWTRGRLMYPDYTGPLNGYRRRGSWTIDYPRSDRHLLFGVKRLTRIDTRSVEQSVALDNSDDIYNWPFVYGVEVGHWTLNEEEADQMRDYLLRGGFFMTDDFHGTQEWDIFMQGMRKVFPRRAVIDIDNKDEIFHVIYDIDQRSRIPGAQFLESHIPWEFDGFDPKFRAIYDDKGRIMVGICHNVDMGDAIEWSDDPRYPENYASLAYRVSANYVMYDLTH
jgi:hypothetical protein